MKKILNRRCVASVLSVLCACVLLSGLFTGCGKKNEQSTTESEVAATESEVVDSTEETQLGIAMPYEAEDGKLTVNSLFQSSVINPDCENAEGENIASLEVINSGDSFIAEAEFNVSTTDGTSYCFKVTGLPAGKKAWLFDTANQSIKADAVCESITCGASYDDSDVMMSDVVSIETDGTQVTISNLSDSEQSNLTVTCHCLFDDIYFGGIAYTYEIDSLSAGDSTTIDAAECYIGSAEVVSIQNN